jgi:HEAT repeat protein
MKASAQEAVPAIERLKEEERESCRLAASIALLEIGSCDCKRELAVVVEGLKSEGQELRRIAAQGLGRLGSKARAALPALREARAKWHNAPGVFEEAIRRIEGR